jgi:hypothetical protein
LASNEEKDRYRAAQIGREIEAGRATVADLPEAYGGRPTGTTRRSIRRQAEYDKQLGEQIRQQQMLQTMDTQQKQFELQSRQENRLLNEQEARRNAERLQAKIDEKNAAVKNIAFGVMADADLDDPSSYSRVVKQISGIAGALEDEDVRSGLGVIRQAADSSMGSIARKQQQEMDDKFAQDMQKLMETGVTEDELPQFFDPESPIGTPRFDQRKVAARLGSTTAKAKEEVKTTKVETPIEKIGLDLQQAYGELNSLVFGGQDSAAAAAKVAGLRERFKAATGEEAPEIPLQPKSKAEYDRISAGMSYIGPDGKRRVKK